MTRIAQILEAANAVKEAEETLHKETDGVIAEILTGLFRDNVDISNIIWMQKASPYDDEGMYEGIHGPFVNFIVGEVTFDDWWEWHRQYPSSDPRLKDLRSVLTAAGERILSEVYGDAHCVIAYRQDNGFAIMNEYAGY